MSRRLLGAALLVVAGATAVIGTFLPLYWEGSDYGETSFRFTTTSWEIVSHNAPENWGIPNSSPQFGVPIAAAAVLLAVAAALVFLPEAQRLVARYLAIAATGVLIGSVSATGAVVALVVGNQPAETDVGGFTVGAGDGMTLLGLSVVGAVIGVVLLHARRAGPRPDGPRSDGPVVYRVVDDVEGDDTDTPPFGIPVGDVEVARIPESEYERPSDAPEPGGRTA